jgi:hypothetical protein
MLATRLTLQATAKRGEKRSKNSNATNSPQMRNIASRALLKQKNGARGTGIKRGVITTTTTAKRERTAALLHLRNGKRCAKNAGTVVSAVEKFAL